MTICRQWTLVKHSNPFEYARVLKCRSWQCDFCAPERKSQLLALAASGRPQRFLTLTINPDVGTDPRNRLRLLSHAWRTLVKRLRRLYPGSDIEYLCVVEETKNHEPHLHILLRSPYIPQSLVSGAMRELIHSPIVDIRAIRNQGEVVRYVAKYITKAPKQFERSKRYWHSTRYEIEPPEEATTALKDGEWYEVLQRPIHLVAYDLAMRGYEFSRIDDDCLVACPADGARPTEYAFTASGHLYRPSAAASASLDEPRAPP